VEARGVDLAVSEVGRGTPLIWGHGLTSDRSQEDRMGFFVPQLSEDRYRVVRYDARGHGASGASADPADYGYPALAQDQLALADALGIDRYVAAGASLGAGTALHAAVAAPDRIRALVLTIPPTGWEGRQDRGRRYRAAGDLLRAEGVEAVLEQVLAEPLAPLFEPFADQVRAGVADRYRSFDPGVLATVLAGVGASDLPDREEIARIAVPTLVLAWAGDPVHPEATAHELGRLIAGAEVEVAPSLRDVLGWSERVRAFLDHRL
jgi:pimeloyl-ACP methyl ester carboxylesterase